MSKIALTPNASGTGTLTIAAPNTSTNRTITLPDETGSIITTGSSGKVIPSAALPAGSVVQVINTTQNGSSQNTTSTTLQASGFYVDITPTSASNKIYVTATFAGRIAWSANSAGGVYTIKRDGTTNLLDQSDGQLLYTVNSLSVMHSPITLQGFDSPATTSSTRYEIYYKAFANATAGMENWGKVVITAMEIAA